MMHGHKSSVQLQMSHADPWSPRVGDACPRTLTERTRFVSALGPLAFLPTPYNVQRPPTWCKVRPCNDDEEVDARIYIRNVPQEYNEDFIRGVIAQYGQPTVVEFLVSRLMNGRRSGFIHMRSYKAALQAVDAIRRTRLPNSDEFLHAKLQAVQPKQFEMCPSSW